jgi:hypothetical protein
MRHVPIVCADLPGVRRRSDGVALFQPGPTGADDRSNRRCREPACCTGFRSRVRVWDRIADPICWGGRPDGIKCATIGLVNEP